MSRMTRNRTARTLATAVALAATVATSMVIAQPASAAPRHRLTVRVGQMKLFPAHLRPGYVGMPGYSGGPPGSTPFSLIEFPNNGLLGTPGSGLLRNGGLLGSGLPLSTGIFNGVPIFGNIGL